MGSNRKAMMAAVREAAKPSILFKGSSLANGLRCIRTFEQINGVEFDPCNELHLSTVRGMGVHQELMRKVDLLTARMKRPKIANTWDFGDVRCGIDPNDPPRRTIAGHWVGFPARAQ